MDRLTYVKCPKQWDIGRHPTKYSSKKTFQQVVDKLAAYEDIGLTPEEIENTLANFSVFLCYMTNGRMSKTNYTVEAMRSEGDNCIMEMCNECEDRKFSEKDEKAEAEGCLNVLPCKVGDTVWVITPDFDVPIEGVVTIIEHNIYTSPMEWITVKAEFPIFGVMEKKSRIDMVIGKTVFLTYEEAEAALKGESK